MTTKSIFLSKTFWVQATALLSLAVPQVRAWLDNNPEQFVGVFAAVNVLVRFATSGKINIFGAGELPEDKTRGSGGPGGLSLLIVMGTAAGLCFTALPSCSVAGEYPITGSVTFRDPNTGAKAGLTFYPPVRQVRAEK